MRKQEGQPIQGKIVHGVIMLIRCLTLLIALFSLSCHSAMAQQLDVMVGQMIMAGFRGQTVTKSSQIMQDIRERHLGGVILFDYDVMRGWYSRNIKNQAQVSRLTADLNAAATIPLIVAVDQEGGAVQRLKKQYGFSETPSAQILGKKDDQAVLEAGEKVGKELKKVGFTLDFAPVADVNIRPDSPAIGKIGRSFSADPERVAVCDRLFIKGLAHHDILGCLKHFPGHGSAGTDSHQGLTDVTGSWSEKELIPYRRLIADGTAKVIMTAHIFNSRLDPKFPATLSHKVITGLLREQLGFDGVVVTDDMNMGAITAHYGLEESVRLAIQAGADILLFGNNLTFDPMIVTHAHRTIMKLVSDGVISRDRIAESYARIMKLKGFQDKVTPEE
ncbi:glycoside hydrolase family 3 protein [Pseudodesulfovibrio piezophilus]|uniref:Glycoside hydrolase family 3 domain protein n=1 Tax=Pseudodesulfovibrio piezophilus (strain DSM 21447 / JCM 15486 / C1TLV30) TaxID=1322246 RepID=M1WPX0_PSEP2|nr:glycoside hydrolase family 3 N-terminal domain-containing protein [Pseudodesulfovibrio piezophilus]CCH48639.1 Glycoside hydrolase family 3 domain protein [Pseudodesulfovibrio piezophilus C1TLV30]